MTNVMQQLPKSTYKYVEPNESQKEVMEEMRDAFKVLHELIQRKIPQSRGRSIAITKLEESAMWVNKAITNNDSGIV